MNTSKVCAIAAAMALAFALAGCAAPAPSSSSAEPESSSASSVSDVAKESSSTEAQEVEAVEWADAKDAAAAAKGAGFETFGVMKKVTIGDQKFKNPTFSYAGKVARALYETGATALDVRKADGKHKVALTDRDKTEFASKWTKSYEDLDVTLYGPAKGAATVITWTDGTASYGVTFQGLGGEEMTMDSDEAAAIVKGFKKANTKEEPKEEPAPEQPAEPADPSGGQLTITQDEAINAAMDVAGANQCTTVYQDYVDGHGWVWVVGTADENGNENTYYVDNYGNPYNAEFDSNSSTEMTLSEGDATAIAESTSGGKVTSSYVEQTENHGLCWHITTEDENGNVMEYHVDNDGNAFNIEFE